LLSYNHQTVSAIQPVQFKKVIIKLEGNPVLGNGSPADVVDGETEEDQRNKRYLNFGFGADSSSSSSSGGGSGNFFFDIIRVSTCLKKTAYTQMHLCN
jgi:hypothetical protein